MKKIILPGLLTGVVMLIASMIMGQVWNLIFPSLQAEYQNTALFRPWSDPLMQLFFAQPFILGIILAWIWNKTKKLFNNQKECCQKGINLALMYWVITIPGMFISYSCFPISLAMIISWSGSILVQSICAGLILAKLNK